jgi:UDP-4-amino-4,6-dideoxy-N-acetyl-beta-L-altrosamine transaminase
MIPYGRQDVSPSDIEAVVQVLQSDFLTQGPAVPAFEAAVARRVKARHALAVSSATAALHVACLALDLGPGDWLWTSPITFVASANCALYCGAQVDFVDIDPRSYNMSAQALEAKLIEAKRRGRLPKIVVPVHLCGQPCDMARIHELAQEYGFKVIEDASHAIGGVYRDQPIGDGRYSDITVFSFHPVKIITTGEGGMAVTNDDVLARKMSLLRSHGITRDAAQMEGASEGGWYYEQIALGFNYRMTDVQAALGHAQLQRLDDYVLRRRALVARYEQLLAQLPVLRPWQHPDGLSAWHLYVLRMPFAESGKSRDQVYEQLREAGIGVNVHYIPVHRQPYYRKLGFKGGAFPEAETYYKEAITLPLYPTLSQDQQDQVVLALKRILKA